MLEISVDYSYRLRHSLLGCTMGLFRTFLALSVFSWHMASEDGHFMLNGALAVLSFYVISGFLMSLTFSQNYQQRESGTRLFFLNRALRIYPPYLVVIAATVLFHYLSGDSNPFIGYESKHGVGLPLQIGVAASNVVIFGMDVLTYLSKSNIIWLPFNSRLFSPSWSLACELLFYLGVPWIASKSWRWLLGLIVLTLTLRYMLGGDLPWRYDIDFGRYYLAPATWIFFLLGMLSFRLAESICSAFSSAKGTYPVVALFVIILTVAGVDRFGNLDSLRVWCYYLSLALALPVLWNASKSSVVDDWIGKFSYPIYLVHPLLIEVHDYLFGKDQAALTKYAIVAPCLVVAAVILHFAVERPIQFVRVAVRRKRSAERDRPDVVAEVEPRFAATAGQMEVSAARGGTLPAPQRHASSPPPAKAKV
jgi:peptidoglycan/LPS O-acetylase OafA/YrhL